MINAREYLSLKIYAQHKNVFGKLREMKNNGEIFDVWSFKRYDQL